MEMQIWGDDLECCEALAELLALCQRNLAVTAITSSDYNLIQGYVFWMALIYMVINLIVDASYVYIDPRMRLKR